MNQQEINILIVEDDITSAQMLKSLTVKSGYTVVGVVSTGEEAIEKAGQLKNGLILMDIGLLGKIDGIEAAEQIHKEFQIPFIYITGGSDKETFERAKKSMPFGYILKPFDINILQATIEMAIYKYQVEQELVEYKNKLENKVAERTEKLSNANEMMAKEMALREQAEEDLMIFNSAVEQSPNSVIIVNQKGIVEYVNKMFAKLSGHSVSDLIGIDVATPGNPVIAEHDIWKKMTSGDKWRGEIYNINKTGEIYYGSAYVSTIKDSDNKVSRYIIVTEDITREKKEKLEVTKIQETLEKSKIDGLDKELDWQEWKEKMKTLNTSRTDRSLFKNIHNSFTQGAGFGAIISLIEMLSTGAIKQDSDYIVDGTIFDLMLSNVATAQDTFKTFSSIDWIIANDFELERLTLQEMYDFLKAVIHKAKEYCPIKNQNIAINELNFGYNDICVNMNKEYFYKAFYELLLNALKFSKNDSYITVVIRIISRDITISIVSSPLKEEKDIIGIPKEYAVEVFEPFYRLTKFVYEKYKTLDFGLGLTLVEKIVNKHGGEVAAENIMDHSNLKQEPQVKVNFTIKLPVAKDK
ncbi:MAG: response regulator [bacterium]|nr:response regulator [bacterium]